MTLNGYSISQLNNFGAADTIRPSDLLFVSQPAVPGARFSSQEYVSESLPYGIFIEKLFADLSAAFGFGGMIHELSSNYARTGHKHPYNFFDIRPVESYDEDKHVVIATFTIDGRKVRIVMPRPFIYKEPEPAIGELKFIATPNITPPSQIDINSSDFDGWVYPMGQTYYVQCGQFREAKEVFGQNPDFNQLTIPNLSSFFRANPAPSDGVEHVEANYTVPRHDHGNALLYFEGTKSLNVDISVGIGVNTNTGPYGVIQPGREDPSQASPYEGEIALNAFRIISANGDIGASGSRFELESYPTHNLLPVMIYIGKNVNEDGDYASEGHTRIFTSNGQEWRINVADLTRQSLEWAGSGAQP